MKSKSKANKENLSPDYAIPATLELIKKGLDVALFPTTTTRLKKCQNT